MLAMTLLFSFASLLHGFLWLLLIIAMLLLIGVILLQEGKGGGLAEAFGGAGAETFGVKAHGINKFTAVIGGVFLLLCVVLNKFSFEPDATPLDPSFKPSAEPVDPQQQAINDLMDQINRQNGGAPAGGAPTGGAPTGGAPAGSVTPPPAGGGAPVEGDGN